jgi:AAA15 family ATPase/GTPase
MLSKFSVKNFKSFEKKLVFDLSQTRDYEFEKHCIKDGIVNKAVVYGYNGIGKSNLALAMMDIVVHLTDKHKILRWYENYLNANSKEEIAEFSYIFNFNGDLVEYYYGKLGCEDIVYENFSINNKKIISYDRRKQKSLLINLAGTETLNKKISEMKISLLKYIKSNAVLSNKDKDVELFNKFIDYVNNMLLFWTLDTKNYSGYEVGNFDIYKKIIENKKFDELKAFLKEVELESNLKYEINAKGYSIYYNYSNRKIDFWETCSSGTKALIIFYFWLQLAENNKNMPSLLFIDEFDAFYHFKMSKFVVEKLKEISSQVIITTHNTSIMSNEILRPDCYFFMYKDKIKSLACLTDKELRFAHNLEKMYRAGAFSE